MLFVIMPALAIARFVCFKRGPPVRGSRCVAPGAWLPVRGSRCVAPGAWLPMRGSRCGAPDAGLPIDTSGTSGTSGTSTTTVITGTIQTDHLTGPLTGAKSNQGF